MAGGSVPFGYLVGDGQEGFLKSKRLIGISNQPFVSSVGYVVRLFYASDLSVRVLD